MDYSASGSIPFMRLSGARMADNGWPILPIAASQKFPGEYYSGTWVPMSNWQQYAHIRAPEVLINIWANWPGSGVGIACGGKFGVVAIDIDVLDAEISGNIRRMIEADLGETPLIRVGKEPKCMLVYRLTEPMDKIALHPLEVLGTGQQFVAYGTHPATGKPYRWIRENPTDTTLDSIPVVTPADVDRAVRKAHAFLPEELKAKTLSPVRETGITRSHTAQNAPLATPEAIREALRHIPNPDLSWDDWKRVLMATWAASGGAAFLDFAEWSYSSKKHDHKATVAEWNSCGRSPPTKLGFGTLYHLAKQHGWKPPHDLAFNEDKDVSNMDLSGFDAMPITPAAEEVQLPAVPSFPSIPRPVGSYRTVRDALQAAAADERAKILSRAGLSETTFTDTNGDVVNTLTPTTSDVTDVNAYVENALQTVIEGVDDANLFAFEEPKELQLTREEIENGTIPRAFAEKFPQEWLYTSSMIGRIAKWVDDRCPISHRIFSLMASFTFFATIVGRQYRTTTGLRPNLACIMIAGTGSGKEGPRNAIVKLMHEIDAMNLSGPRGGFSSGSGVIEGLMNQPCMWLAVDEFGKKIAAYGAGRIDQNQREMIAMFLEAIANDFVGGKGYANSLENPVKNVRFPNLNIFASSQMEEITASLSSAATADGLIQRFLFCPTFADYVPMKRGFNPPPVPEDIAGSLKWLIADLQTLGGDFAENGNATTEPQMRVVQMTQQAWMLFHSLDERKVKMAQEGRVMWVRSAAMAVKIAMLEAIAIDPINPLIDAPLLDSARRLVDWFTVYAEQFVRRKIADTSHERALNNVYAIVERAGLAGLSRNDLVRQTQKFKPEDRDAYLAQLLEAGRIKATQSDREGRGPKATIYTAIAA